MADIHENILDYINESVSLLEDKKESKYIDRKKSLDLKRTQETFEFYLDGSIYNKYNLTGFLDEYTLDYFNINEIEEAKLAADKIYNIINSKILTNREKNIELFRYNTKIAYFETMGEVRLYARIYDVNKVIETIEKYNNKKTRIEMIRNKFKQEMTIKAAEEAGLIIGNPEIMKLIQRIESMGDKTYRPKIEIVKEDPYIYIDTEKILSTPKIQELLKN